MDYRKDEYIEKFGLDKWNEHIRKRREYNRKFEKDNEEYVKERHRQWYLNNRESALINRKKNYDKNAERERERARNKARENPEIKSNYRKTEMGRAGQLSGNYNVCDKNNGLDISKNITAEWIVKNIFTSKCIYCGDSDWKHLGADRIDNSKPHTPDNVVCACGICNVERSDRFTVEEFVEHRKTHPRVLGSKNEKSWEFAEVNGKTVIRKK